MHIVHNISKIILVASGQKLLNIFQIKIRWNINIEHLVEKLMFGILQKHPNICEGLLLLRKSFQKMGGFFHLYHMITF